MSDPATAAYLMDLVEDEKERQAAIVKARDYHDGEQPVEITDRLREFLGLSSGAASPYTYDPLAPQGGSPFVLNVSRIVVDAVVERLNVIGFDSDEPAGADGTKPLAAWAWQRWTQNRMDGTQGETHTAAVRDGCGYILVDGDDVQRRARFTFLPEYTDAAECDGDGYGIRLAYAGDEDTIVYAQKFWIETRITAQGERITRNAVRRMDMFWPDRVERYEMQKGAWARYQEQGVPWPRPWVDTLGRPLGIPVIPFCNVDDRCEASDAWPIQDLINKTLVDLAAAADIAALGLMVTFGFFPTTDGQPPAEDGSNALVIQPGSFISTLKPPRDADAKRIPGEDVTPIAQLIQQYILWLAGVTSTPASRFTPSTNVKAEGTLKTEEIPLLAKIRPKQTIFGNAWEDVLYMARRIENTFYGGALDEEVMLTTQWAPTATRDELQERQALLVEKQLNVPDEKLWAKLGYSQDEIAEMQAMKEAAQQRALEQQQAMAAVFPPKNGQAVTN